LKVGNDSLSGTGQKKNFTWNGSSDEIVATQKDVPIGVSRSGPWAIFRLMSDGHPQNRGSAIYDLDFVRQNNNVDIVVNGKKQTYSYELHFLTGDPWAEFSGLRCVSQVTRER
jgi:type VI protein secretion system component VasK